MAILLNGLFKKPLEYGIIYSGDIMKNYKVTNRGKILLTTIFIAMIGSYFFNSIIFYFLSGLFLAIVGIEIINYLVHSFKNNPSKTKALSNEEKFDVEEKTENLEETIRLADEGQEKQQEMLGKVTENKLTEEASHKNNEGIALEDSEEEYEKMVDDYESIEEDIQSMERDLEALGKQANHLSKESVENYYLDKKKEIDSNLENSVSEASQIFEEESLIDTLFDKLKDFLSFKRYRKGDLVLHNHFGIGKIIETEETLKVSFINEQIEEIIEFEYDKNNKIPELNLFKAPKSEDERQYYYNYKRDISEELLNTIDKINLNLPDIECQWNVFLKSEGTFEKHDFIVISDQVHVFSKTSKNKIQCHLLEELLKDIDLEIKKHEISDYSSINSILLKAKVKGLMSLDQVNAVNQRIAEANIKDFNERMQYSVKTEDL